MPLYEYRCETCGGRLEVLQRVGEGPAGLSCPDCGSPRLSKEFSTFASTGSDGGLGGGCAPSGRFT